MSKSKPGLTALHAQGKMPSTTPWGESKAFEERLPLGGLSLFEKSIFSQQQPTVRDIDYPAGADKQLCTTQCPSQTDIRGFNKNAMRD